MDWSIVAFSAAVAWPAAALFKYGFTIIDRVMYKNLVIKTLVKVIKTDMKEEIIDSIENIVAQTTLQAIYSDDLQFEVVDEEGSRIVKVTRANPIATAGE